MFVKYKRSRMKNFQSKCETLNQIEFLRIKKDVLN